jgi:endonuclease/exonuclease/phosphatase family metal-dependent hydrolase
VIRGGLTAAGVTAGTTATEIAMPSVMTLNLANYNDHGNWSERLQIIVGTIVDKNPDVIAVQEVRFDPAHPSTQSSYQSMAEQIVYLLNRTRSYAGVDIVSQPLVFYSDSAKHYPSPPPHRQFWEGLAILSRQRVLETGSIFLTHTGSDANLRGTQFARIASGDTPFTVFNTHFGLDEAERESNARETLAYMNRFAGPRLLVGDLNAEPGEPALTVLSKGGLTDLWAKLEPNQKGSTYPSCDPSARDDYVWGDATVATAATTIELVATQPVNGTYASDHFGLLVTIAL